MLTCAQLYSDAFLFSVGGTSHTIFCIKQMPPQGALPRRRCPAANHKSVFRRHTTQDTDMRDEYIKRHTHQESTHTRHSPTISVSHVVRTCRLLQTGGGRRVSVRFRARPAASQRPRPAISPHNPHVHLWQAMLSLSGYPGTPALAQPVTVRCRRASMTSKTIRTSSSFSSPCKARLSAGRSGSELDTT